MAPYQIVIQYKSSKRIPLLSLCFMQIGPVQILTLCVDQLHCLMSSRVHVQPTYRLFGDCLLHILDLHAMHRDQCVPIHLSMHTVFMDQMKEFSECQTILAALPDAACTCGGSIHRGYRRFKTSLQTKVSVAVPVLCLQEIQVSTLITFCNVLCMLQHVIKNQAFGPASLECAALGQVAGHLALVLLINYFFRFHCPLSRHPHDVNAFPGFRTHQGSLQALTGKFGEC